MASTTRSAVASKIVGGAQGAGDFEFLVGDVDCNDPFSSCSARAKQGGHTHAAKANNRHRVAGDDGSAVHHRADAGEDRATEQRGVLKAEVTIDLDQRAARNGCVLSESRHAQVVVEKIVLCRTMLTESPPAGEQDAGAVGGSAWYAQGRASIEAALTCPAARDEDENHVIADLEIIHAQAKRLNDAGRLVTEHHRQRPRAVAVDYGKVGVAEAAATMRTSASPCSGPARSISCSLSGLLPA